MKSLLKDLLIAVLGIGVICGLGFIFGVIKNLITWEMVMTTIKLMGLIGTIAMIIVERKGK